MQSSIDATAPGGRTRFTWLSSLVTHHERAWDVGTGNGQAAHGLAAVFDAVVATDASATQIANVEAHPKIAYAVGGAEASGLAAGSIDLVLAAQAFH